MSARIDGIDLSHWQSGSIDFRAAQKAGVRFVFHKATEGVNYRDPGYLRRLTQVSGVKGLLWGAYHFARPAASDGTTQARYFLSVANPRPGHMRPMLDLEDRANLSQHELTRWVAAFVAEVKRETGEVPFIYTPFDLGDHFDCPLWVARYSDAMSAPRIPQPWKAHTIWQFSDGKYGHPNTVPGVGPCDINTLNTSDPAALLARFVLGAADERTAKPAKQPAPKHHPRAEQIATRAEAGVKATKPNSPLGKFFRAVAQLAKPYQPKK